MCEQSEVSALASAPTALCPLRRWASAIDTDVIVLRALVADASGTKILQAHASGQQPEDVAKEVVEELFSAGAQQVLDDIRDRR